MKANIVRLNVEHAGEPPTLLPVPITVGRIVLAPSPRDPSTFNPQPASASLTAAVMTLPATEPFIGSHEMFHVELMGDLAGHFTRLGRALERKDKSTADWSHAHALAEELAQLVGLNYAESKTDAAGVVAKS